MTTAQIRALQKAIQDRLRDGYAGNDNKLLENINSFFEEVVNPATLAPGDRVRFSVAASNPNADADYFYIEEANLCGDGTAEYATDSSAWHRREDFVLVERATVESLLAQAS